MTLTKEWLLRTIAELEEERDSMPGVVNVDAAMALAAMKLALSSLEAKDKIPELRQVIYHFRDWNEGFPVERFKADYVISWMLVNYPPAQPAPVSVPEWTNEQCLEFLSIAFRHAEIKGDLELDDIRLGVKMVNGSRAAMLQGADGTLTNEGTIPANTPCKDAPEHIWLQTAGVWPENGEFSELTWCSDNQHPDDTLYVRADVVTGNSPVVPNGWMAVPVEPTEDMIVNGFESEPDESFSDEKEWEAYDAMSGCQQAAHRAKLCWAAMISAAPKSDVR